MENLLGLAALIGARLKARGETVAVAESSSGGLISAALLSVGGASVYYRGGGVVYTKQALAGLLGITWPLPAGIRRSSTEPYAAFLAETVRHRLEADWGLGESGAAGPAGNGYGDAPGHTCIALAGPLSRVLTLETGDPDRVVNMRAFAAKTLAVFLEALAAVP